MELKQKVLNKASTILKEGCDNEDCYGIEYNGALSDWCDSCAVVLEVAEDAYNWDRKKETKEALKIYEEEELERKKENEKWRKENPAAAKTSDKLKEMLFKSVECPLLWSMPADLPEATGKTIKFARYNKLNNAPT